MNSILFIFNLLFYLGGGSKVQL